MAKQRELYAVKFNFPTKNASGPCETFIVAASNEAEAEQSARHFLNHVYEERAASMVFASAEPQSCILMGNHGDEQYFSFEDDDV